MALYRGAPSGGKEFLLFITGRSKAEGELRRIGLARSDNGHNFSRPKAVLDPTSQMGYDMRGKRTAARVATLYGKAMDAAVENPILGDRFAAAAVAHIDSIFNALKLPSGGEFYPETNLAFIVSGRQPGLSVRLSLLVHSACLILPGSKSTDNDHQGFQGT